MDISNKKHVPYSGQIWKYKDILYLIVRDNYYDDSTNKIKLSCKFKAISLHNFEVIFVEDNINKLACVVGGNFHDKVKVVE